MAETAYERVRRFVDRKHTHDEIFVHQSDLVPISTADLRALADEIEQLRLVVGAQASAMKDAHIPLKPSHFGAIGDDIKNDLPALTASGKYMAYKC